MDARKMPEENQIQVENIDHLGIIAGIVDEIGIVDIINQKLSVDEREEITKGQVVKAMILNGLGFVSQPLYLFSHFFDDKPVEKLLGKRVKTEYLNDDKLGRTLDELYRYGLTDLFILIVLETIKKYQIKTSYSHLDSTSFHLHGEYNLPEAQVEEQRKIIKISQGYSRDHRPDLKQCVLNLIVSSDGEIPVFMKPGNGNQSDKKEFASLSKEYKQRINTESIIVCDSVLYTQENIQLMKNIDWITRVPLTINKAKKLVEEWEFNQEKKSVSGLEEISEIEKKLKEKGYQWTSFTENYGGVAQRWLLVESKSRKESELKKLSQKIPEEKEKLIKERKKLRGRLWCEKKECYREIKEINKKLKYYELEIKEIYQKKEKKDKIKYEAQIEIKEKTESIERKKRAAGRFILATNVLEEKKLKDEEILWNYKEQQKVERGFRFLKTPLFFADSFYVNKVERIEGILWLMAICLLVYNLGQRAVRNQLKRVKHGIKNQVGKKTDRPTLRWIFQCFQGIHLVTLGGKKQVVNLTKDREEILKYLPNECQKYY